MIFVECLPICYFERIPLDSDISQNSGSKWDLYIPKCSQKIELTKAEANFWWFFVFVIDLNLRTRKNMLKITFFLGGTLTPGLITFDVVIGFYWFRTCWKGNLICFPTKILFLKNHHYSTFYSSFNLKYACWNATFHLISHRKKTAGSNHKPNTVL